MQPCDEESEDVSSSHYSPLLVGSSPIEFLEYKKT